jgi:hypothetical protein
MTSIIVWLINVEGFVEQGLLGETEAVGKILAPSALLLGFPFVPFSPRQPPFYIMSRCPEFISNVPLFKCSSVTLNSIDNRSVTDAIVCN